MRDPANEVQQHYNRGLELEREARQSPEAIGRELDAAEEFRIASDLSTKEAEDESLPAEYRILSAVFGEYYLASHYKCLSWYYYETRDLANAVEYLAKQEQALDAAIQGAHDASLKLSGDYKMRIEQMAEQWPGERIALAVSLAAIRARKAWEEDRVPEALDYYRKNVELGQVALKYFQEHQADLPAVRIMRGNVLGMMANAEQVTARLIRDETLRKGLALRDLPAAQLRDMLRSYLSTLLFNEAARAANPEWVQYRDTANQTRKNIEHLLRECGTRWAEIYLEFEDNDELRAVMRSTDVRKFNEVEALRRVEANPFGKLWGVGGFYLLLFCLLFFCVYAFLQLGWWYALLAILGMPVLFLIVSAVILRTTGALSEAGFVETLRIALHFQVSGLTRILGKTPNKPLNGSDQGEH
jgi:hypothetical protein